MAEQERERDKNISVEECFRKNAKGRERVEKLRSDKKHDGVFN